MWGKRRFRHRGADWLTGSLIDVDTVDHLLASRLLRVSHLWLIRNGQTVPPSSYVRVGSEVTARSEGKSRSDVSRVLKLASEGSPDPERVAAFIARGATMTLNYADEYVPAIGDFCRGLEADLGLRTSVNLFITPPGARGFNLHSDPHDIFVVQLHGRKSWEIHPTPWEIDTEAGASVQTHTFEAGDVFYMPEGTRHMARTEDSFSMHMAIQFKVPSQARVLEQALAGVVSAQVASVTGQSDRTPAFAAESAGPLAEITEKRIGELLGSLSHEAVRDAVGGYFHKLLQPARRGGRGAFKAIAAADDIGAHTPLTVMAPIMGIEQDGDGRLRLDTADRSVSVPSWLEPALRHLAAAAAFTPADLGQHVDPHAALVLCRRLAREGILAADRGH